MDKEEILELVNRLKLPESEYCICSSGSLIIRNIHEKAGDFDLQVTKKCFNYILRK